MRRVVLLVLVVIAVFGIVTAVQPKAAAQDGIPGNCIFRNAPYYIPNAFPRYEYHNRRLVLVDWTTGADVRVIEDNLTVEEWEILAWSSDCHYLMAHAGRERVIWDVVNPHRAAVLDESQVTHQGFWEPNSQYVLLGGARGGGYLANLNTGSVIPLEARSGYMFLVVAWNMPLHQLYTIPFDNTGYIQVRDLTTGEITRELTADFGVSRFTVSPDGRYLAAASGYHIAVWDMFNLPADGAFILRVFNDGSMRFINNHTLEANGDLKYRYDLQTGTRSLVLRIPTRYYDGPTDAYSLLLFEGDLYMVQSATGQRTFLRRGQRPVYDPYWDLERGQVLVVLRNSASPGVFNAPDNWLSVFAFDVHTGAQVGWYPLPNVVGPVNFTFSPDGSKVIVYHNEARSGGNLEGLHSGLIVYDRASGAGLEVNVGDFAARSPDQIALSPDNRYLVLGRTTLRVWDLANLPADIPAREPIYRHEGPESRIAAVHFLDATTLETTDYYGVVQKWNLFTGALIPNE